MTWARAPISRRSRMPAACPGWAQDALSWANAAGLINGTVYGGRTILDPQGSASRAQVAMILRSYAEHVVNA